MSLTTSEQTSPTAGKVLVVEDDPVVRRILEVLVSSLGFRVDVADDGDEALPLLAYRDYAAVVCDLSMPGMRGDQLHFECQMRCPEVARRFVFISGHNSAPEATALVRGTGQPCLSKPCRVAELHQAIASVVRPG